jgi:sugar-specific transcriptional regulator TrmB
MDFTTFGLNNRDKRVYEALLAAPHSSIRNMAELTNINRGSVFESIKNLLSVGLITYVEHGDRKKYTAQSPELLHELVNERRRMLLETHPKIDTYIQHLNLMRHDPNLINFASYYDGDEGLAAILRDVLTSARKIGFTEYYSISSPRVSEYLYNRFSHFSRERDKLGLTVKIIGLGKPIHKELPTADRRIFAIPGADSGAYTLIYGKKVAMITIDERKHTSGIVIENEGITNLQRLLFMQIWDLLA